MVVQVEPRPKDLSVADRFSFKQMSIKYGVQITVAADGQWGVERLMQKEPKGRHGGVQNVAASILPQEPTAATDLFNAVVKVCATNCERLSHEAL
jgi:hypothetical protein